MTRYRERYVSLYTDFGFKKIFGTELNKELLISFLNALLQGEQNITDIQYLNSEQLGTRHGDRSAVFDVYCRNDKGERFIVEMQNAYQQYFKDRTVYYSSFPIQEQGKRGDWDFQLESVYTVGILNFVFPEDEYSPDCYHHEVRLMDTADKHVFFDKLTYIYLEVPKFNKTEEELVTMFDKWMFVLRNLSRLMERPAALQERVFTRLFEQAEVAKFTQAEMYDYEESLKRFRDINNVIDTAKNEAFAGGKAEGIEEGRVEGRAEGIEEGILKVARKMKSKGIPQSSIIEMTGLTAEEIERL